MEITESKIINRKLPVSQIFFGPFVTCGAVNIFCVSSYSINSPKIHKHGVIGNSGSLRHIVSNDQDRKFFFKFQ